MSEIEKLMQNAGIKKEWLYTVKQFNNYCLASKESIIQQFYLFNERKTAKITNARKLYPEFTAEKQLSLIKWLARKGLLQINYSSHQCYQFNSFRVGGDYKTDISEALASHFNNLWQDLTDTEKAEIKRILE